MNLCVQDFTGLVQVVQRDQVSSEDGITNSSQIAFWLPDCHTTAAIVLGQLAHTRKYGVHLVAGLAEGIDHHQAADRRPRRLSRKLDENGG